eukprot:TRINITY_DN9076_c0_g1_i1.p1 TRINITY_DN9076_c0_g1~~TRINITY_DN9076_c0_g1_i1.p1  ORF type:complete len:417 (-),score=188.26 TRINITY_DN9076_c0_g1_i1:39-1289(-)
MATEAIEPIWEKDELLVLNHAVLKFGEANWPSVSRSLKEYFELDAKNSKTDGIPSTPRDFSLFQLGKCAKKYHQLQAETAGATSVDLALSAKEQRLIELKKNLEHYESEILRLRFEVDQISSGKLDEQLLEWKKKEEENPSGNLFKKRKLEDENSKTDKTSGSTTPNRHRSLSGVSTPKTPASAPFEEKDKVAQRGRPPSQKKKAQMEEEQREGLESPTASKKASIVLPVPPSPKSKPDLIKAMQKVYKNVMAHKHSYVFKNPVSAEEAPGYYDIIKKPMDLSLIRKNLDAGKLGLSEFWRDLLQMYQNAMKYNAKGSEIWIMANDMKKFTSKEIDPLFVAEGIPKAKSLLAAERQVQGYKKEGTGESDEGEDDDMEDEEEAEEKKKKVSTPKKEKEKEKSESGKKKRVSHKKKED